MTLGIIPSWEALEMNATVSCIKMEKYQKVENHYSRALLFKQLRRIVLLIVTK
jgi:hypothetical protein